MSPLRDALRLPQVVVRHRELLLAFTRRELKARIEGSILGRVWPVLQPAVLFAIYFLIFTKILKIGFSDDLAPFGEEGKGWRSTFYLITGILPWTLLAESVTRGTSCVLDNANLIKKIAFPSELLPTYTTVVFHVYFMVGFVILLALEMAVNTDLGLYGIPPALAWFPVILVLQFVFINGLCMFLAAANVFVRDVMQAVPVLVTFWMFTTPVFYDLKAVKEIAWHEVQAGGDPAKLEFADRMIEIMSYNPMAVLLDLYRAIFSFGKLPFPVERMVNFALVAVLVQFLAYAFFLRCKGRFADEV